MRQYTVLHWPILKACLLLIPLIPGCSCRDNGSALSARTPVEFHLDWTPDADYIGYFVADEKGFYDEVGLDVTIVPGNGAEQAALLIGEGKVRVGTTTIDAVVRAQTAKRSESEKGNRVPVAVATVFPRNPIVLVSLRDNPIHTIAEVRGKRIGYTEETSVTYQQFLALLKRNGLSRDDLELEQVSWSGPQRLIERQVDGILAYTTDSPVELEAQGKPYVEMFFRDHGMDVAGQCIAVPQSVTTQPEKQEWLRSFISASIRGWEFARRSPDEAADLLVRRFPELDRNKTKARVLKAISLLPDRPTGARIVEPYVNVERTSPLYSVLERTERDIAEMTGGSPREDAPHKLFFNLFENDD